MLRKKKRSCLIVGGDHLQWNTQFTLKSGYSAKSKLFAFGWMLIVLVLATIDSSTNTATVTATQSVSSSPDRLDISQAQEYIILERRSYPTPPDKLGLQIFIYAPTANTFDQRAHTVIKAAYDLLESDGLYEVVVRLSALPSMEPKYIQAGRAKYTPHKKNTWGTEEEYVWEVDASKHSVVDGQLEEDGKFYSLDMMFASSYLKK